MSGGTIPVRDALGHPRAALLATLITAASALGGCSSADARATDPVVETLENGVVVVSNSDRGAWDDDERWTLVEELRIGRIEGSEAELFGDLRDFDVDEAGRMYVLDGSAKEVRVFGTSGEHVRSFGGPGQGPGEFAQPWGLQFDAEGVLHIVDTGGSRHQRWSPGGDLLDERRRFAAGQVAPWPGRILPDATVVDVETVRNDDGRSRRLLIRFDSAGIPTDTARMPAYDAPSFVHETESSRVTAGVPFAPALEWSWTPDGRLLAGVSDEFRFVLQDPWTGDTTRIVRKEHDPIPVRDVEVDLVLGRMEWFRRQGGKLDRSLVPETRPAFTGLTMDNRGFVWVEVPPSREGPVDPETYFEPSPTRFEVFDPDGRYLGEVRAPAPLRAVRVLGDRMYGITRDDLGVSYLVRLGIEGRRSR